MDWNDLDQQTREAASQLLARGFDAAAVRLIVRQTGCTVDMARTIVDRSRSHQPPASVGSWAVR